MKNLSLDGNVDFGPQRVALGDAQSVFDRAVSLYEAALAPPAEILQRTFGFIARRRTATAPDSLAYVYDTFRLGPLTMCKAWKVTEHPYQRVPEVGPVAGNAGIGGAVATVNTSPNVRHDAGGAADIETVVFRCTVKSYTAVPRGSLLTPLPRHPDLTPPSAAAGSSPSPVASASPSLAP